MGAPVGPIREVTSRRLTLRDSALSRHCINAFVVCINAFVVCINASVVCVNVSVVYINASVVHINASRGFCNRCCALKAKFEYVSCINGLLCLNK